jgi:hypothetical protein
MWIPNRTRKAAQRAFRPAADRLETREALSVVTPLLYHSNPSANAQDGQVLVNPAMTGGGFGSVAFNSGGGVFLITTTRTKAVVNLTPSSTTPTTINPIILLTGGRTTSNLLAGFGNTGAGTTAALAADFGEATGLANPPFPSLGASGLGNGTVINPGVITTSAGVGGTGGTITISPSGAMLGGVSTGTGTAAGTITFPTR